MKTYTEIQSEIQKLEKDRRDLKHTFLTQDKKLSLELDKLFEIRKLIEDGLDTEASLVGSQILYIKHPDYHSKECLNQLDKAIENIRTGGTWLQIEYFGVKSYSGWNSQEVDCDYGMGPTHGSVWFEIGMKPEYRKKTLTDDEIIACVRYLKFMKEKISKTQMHFTSD